MKRMPWLVEARKRVYSTQKDWVSTLNEMGFDIPQSTIANWEASGFLPISLAPEALNIVCRSLNMRANDVLRLQGVEISEQIGDTGVPNEAASLFGKIIETKQATLEKIMPLVEAHFDMLRSHLED